MSQQRKHSGNVGSKGVTAPAQLQHVGDASGFGTKGPRMLGCAGP